jgi:hypothetical protein
MNATADSNAVAKVHVDAFTRGYIECMLWAEVLATDPDDPNYDTSFRDANYDEKDLAPKTLAKIIEDCADFQHANEADLREYEDARAIPTTADYTTMECAGHDFWLTRNGHGAGFWDRGLGSLGDRLTKASNVHGSRYLYLGDDGLIYCA